jgi:leader peptidase (prepilin peptidase) / N-methyltransferase
VGGALSALPIWFVLATFAILGAIWGSFVGALCSRWPKGETVTHGRSHCDHCERQLASYDLVPIISFLVLRGKCRDCGHKIRASVVGIELAAACIGAFSALILPVPQALAAAIFGWLLLPLIILDYHHLWLPNILVLPLAGIGMLLGHMLATDIAIADQIIGGAVGFISLEFVRRVYIQYRRREGMGAGDPKLFGALGIWLGWEMLPIILLLASAIGLAFAWALRRNGGGTSDQFPLGSYLCVAGLVIAWAH